MKTKAELWCEAVVAAVVAPDVVNPESYADRIVKEAEARGFVCAPLTEVQALRELEREVRKHAQVDDFTTELLRIDYARKGAL